MRSFLRNSKAGIAVLLAAQAAALGWAAWRVGITFDEPSHLAAACMYWQGRDVLHPSDSPPLMRILSGWAPRVLRAPLPQDTRSWPTQSSFDIGREILQTMEAGPAHRLMFVARLPFLIFPLLTVWLLWHWGRQLFSEGIALVIGACAVFEPTMLGHGFLVKSDVAAAFGCLLFFYAAWRYWQRPNLRRTVGMALALVVAVLAKFTLLALIPMAVILVLWRGPRWAGVALVLGTTYLGLVAAYQFRARPIQKAELDEMRAEGLSRLEVATAKVLGRLPWPPQFVRGIRYIGSADRNEGFPAYMLGRRIEYGAPWYFPLAWAVKFPIALQLLTLAGVSALVLRLIRREAGAADAFVWGPAVIVLALAMRSHIHLGFRHVLPMVPFLLLGAGFALERWGRRSVGRAAMAFCLVWVAVASIRIYPQGISYFNEWVGGPESGWKYLADSNLDWGQNLPDLRRYLVQNGVERVRTYYFGNDVLWHHIPWDSLEMQAAPWAAEWEKETRLQPAPGVYAISVNSLLGYFFSPAYRNYFAYFKARRPDAKAGYSIFIYYVK